MNVTPGAENEFNLYPGVWKGLLLSGVNVLM